MLKVKFGTKGITILKTVLYTIAGISVVSSGMLVKQASQIGAVDTIYRKAKECNPDVEDATVDIRFFGK